MTLSLEYLRSCIDAGEVVSDIGQIDERTKRQLDRFCKQGAITKWRGRWWPIAGARDGIGPMKTCYALPAIAAWAQSDEANKAALREWNRMAAIDSLHRACRRAGVPLTA